jgi:hypothetical protein
MNKSSNLDSAKIAGPRVASILRLLVLKECRCQQPRA